MIQNKPANVPDHVLEKCIDGLLADASKPARGPIEQLSDLTPKDKDAIRDAFTRESYVGRDEPRYLFAVVELILARKVVECTERLERLHRESLERVASVCSSHTDDGSGIMLPDAYDGVSPADGGGVA